MKNKIIALLLVINTGNLFSYTLYPFQTIIMYYMQQYLDTNSRITTTQKQIAELCDQVNTLMRYYLEIIKNQVDLKIINLNSTEKLEKHSLSKQINVIKTYKILEYLLEKSVISIDIATIYKHLINRKSILITHLQKISQLKTPLNPPLNLSPESLNKILQNINNQCEAYNSLHKRYDKELRNLLQQKANTELVLNKLRRHI